MHETEYADDAGDTTDINLDTLELYFKPDLNKWVHGYVELEYDDDDDSIKGEEARIILKNTDEFPLYAAFGKYEALPFGNFETFMIEDSLTESLGETKEVAAVLGFEQAGFNLEASIFNADDVTEIDEDDDPLDQYTLMASYGKEIDALSLQLGGSYYNNIANAGDMPDLLAQDEIKDYVGGLGVHAILGWQGLYLIGEYITALQEFEDDELLFDHSGAQPNVWNVELAYETEIKDHETIFALAYQGTDEAISVSDVDDTLPESRVAASVGVELFKNVSLAFEFMHDENYSDNDFASSGWNLADYSSVADQDKQTFITELAFEF
ncbi:MAG: LbtU family siderophore porin [Thermodesulfobacteriota bacterium]